MRGKVIPFESKTINNLYGMPNIEYDAYKDYLNNHLALDKVFHYLSITSIEWKIGKDRTSTFSVHAI